MKIASFVLGILLLCQPLMAQKWELHIASGASSAKLIPSSTSTSSSRIVHYSFGMAGKYFSTELVRILDAHNRITFGYDATGYKAGIQIRTGSYFGTKEYSYDLFNLHALSAGYAYRAGVCRERLLLSAFVKLGIGYGILTGIGEGGGTGMVADQMMYTYTKRNTGFEVAPDYWTPVSTVGIGFNPRFKNIRFRDRFDMVVSATMPWKKAYVKQSETSYAIAANGIASSGTAHWHGCPLIVKAGVDYALFRFHNKKTVNNQ